MECVTFKEVPCAHMDTPTRKYRELSVKVDKKDGGYVCANIYPDQKHISIMHLFPAVKIRGLGTALLAKLAHQIAMEMPETREFTVNHDQISDAGLGHLKRIGLKKIASNKPNTKMNFGIYRTILVHKAKTLGFKLEE